ncbi:unnamed protein product, partial [Amoebophrya sp. A25]
PQDAPSSKVASINSTGKGKACSSIVHEAGKRAHKGRRCQTMRKQALQPVASGHAAGWDGYFRGQGGKHGGYGE